MALNKGLPWLGLSLYSGPFRGIRTPSRPREAGGWSVRSAGSPAL